jgi:hypothetical protein
MNPTYSLIVLVLTFSCAVSHRPIKIIGYPYIPDLNGDYLVSLADFLQDRFYLDTSRRIEILYDFTYSTDTYTPPLVVQALTTGGYDMQEIDTIILGYLLQQNVLQRIPDDVSYAGFSPNSVQMTADLNGVQWGHPSYTCTNIYYSLNRHILSNRNANDFFSFVEHNVQANQLGWTGDLSSEPDLRLEYLAGWRNSFPNQYSSPWYPSGYSANQLNTQVINNVNTLRDFCDDKQVTPHVNNCTNGNFYDFPDQWFYQFATGGSLVLQGFPEYTSEILKRTNADPNNPSTLHYAIPALIGNGNEGFAFTDAWVISRTNCDSDCLSTAKIFLNWQRENWAELISLGQDLNPVRPRFLTVAYQPFYFSTDMFSLPDFAQDYYQYFNYLVNVASPLDTTHYWDNEASQSAAIEALVLDSYTP